MEILTQMQELMEKFIQEQQKHEKQIGDKSSQSLENAINSSNLVTKPKKRAYVRKNPEVVKAAREANVLINRFSRAVRNKQRFRDETQLAEEWMEQVRSRFPHLLGRAQPMFEELTRNTKEPAHLTPSEPELTPNILVESALPEPMKRKAEVSVEQEEEEKPVVLKKPLPETPAESEGQEQAVVIGADEGTTLKTAVQAIQRVDDGLAHSIKPLDYKAAMRNLFRSLNK